MSEAMSDDDDSALPAILIGAMRGLMKDAGLSYDGVDEWEAMLDSLEGTARDFRWLAAQLHVPIDQNL